MTNGKRTKLSDIAAMVGLSEATVSRALADPAAPVAPGTRRAILDAAAKLKYQPRTPGKSARIRSGDYVGVVVRDVRDPFFPPVLHYVIEATQALGVGAVFGFGEGKVVQARKVQEILDTRDCKGLLLVGDFQRDVIGEDLIGSGMPIVGLCQGERLSGIPVVNNDNALGCRKMMEHLLDLGHRRIAFLGSEVIEDLDERRQAYLEFMKTEKLHIPRGYAVPLDGSESEDGGRGMRRLHKLPDRPTAVVAATDAIALGCLKEAENLGWKVPGEVSVGGYDDIYAADYSSPSLTTVKQPCEALARGAVRVLRNLIELRVHPGRGRDDDRSWPVSLLGQRSEWPSGARYVASKEHQVVYLTPTLMPRHSTDQVPVTFAE